MYDHKKVEGDITKLWEKEETHAKLDKKLEKGEPFYFCDGPPYATGQIHPGTGWNKCVKDAVCRYQRSEGRRVRAQAGYDTHGLPIEVKVEQEMKLKNKNEIEEKIGVENFVQECKKFATKYIGVMGKDFRRLGVWMDFEDPYITYKDPYIEASWGTLKKAHEKGLMNQGEYVLPYCHRCETTMANYELEYGEETDPSIYVKMRSKDKPDEYFIIWTTTPWTLVANMAIMVHPTLAYVKIKVGDEKWIVAKDRLEHITGIIGESVAVLEETTGKKLDGKEYLHPFADRIGKKAERRIVLSDEYVTTEDGTGLVHCAPGHGPEDFIIGKRFGIEAFSPVDGQGKYTKEAGEFAGKHVREANTEIIGVLDGLGVLVHKTRVKHRYPHCWRCKTPLIFRTTKQWFITVSKLKEKMQKEIEFVEWHPQFAKTRFKEFVENAPDWCISRQRYWGIPLPIWRCPDEKCGKIKVVGSKSELPKKVKELHRPYIDEVKFKCECGEEMSRIPDVLDVWFDSGNAVWACLRDGEKEIFEDKASLIIEGQDQIRGWFYSLLGSGIVRYDASPYKALVMHGFFVDEKGEKMSKSVGNFVPLEEIMEKYGADSFRLWSLSNTIWEELKFNWTELKEAHSDLDILFNMFVFLDRFYPKEKIAEAELYPEDKWLVSRTKEVGLMFHSAFQSYELNRAVKEVRKLLTEDLSRWYMKSAKDRIAKDDNRDGALWTVHYCTFAIVKMLAMITPFISEHIYRGFFAKHEKEESVTYLSVERPNETDVDQKLHKEMETVQEIVALGNTLRQEAKVKIRWPLRELVVKTESSEVKDAVRKFEPLIKRLSNVRTISVNAEASGERYVKAAFTSGELLLDKELDEELYAAGMLNEIKRRIQMTRKELNLVEKDHVSVTIEAEKEIEAIVEKNSEALAKDVNASSLKIGKLDGAKEFEIDGRVVKLDVKKGH